MAMGTVAQLESRLSRGRGGRYTVIRTPPSPPAVCKPTLHTPHELAHLFSRISAAPLRDAQPPGAPARAPRPAGLRSGAAPSAPPAPPAAPPGGPVPLAPGG